MHLTDPSSFRESRHHHSSDDMSLNLIRRTKPANPYVSFEVSGLVAIVQAIVHIMFTANVD